VYENIKLLFWQFQYSMNIA